eukprot:g10579.t1
MEALKHTSSRFDEELSQLREELQQTRSEATAAATEAQKQEAIAAAKEAAQWRASFEQLLHKKFEELEIIRSKDYVFSELAEQHKHSVKNLSELWSSQNLQRERELHLLREQAENALMEMKSSIGSAQLASSKAESEQRALSESRLQVRPVSSEKRELSRCCSQKPWMLFQPGIEASITCVDHWEKNMQGQNQFKLR